MPGSGGNRDLLPAELWLPPPIKDFSPKKFLCHISYIMRIYSKVFNGLSGMLGHFVVTEAFLHQQDCKSQNEKWSIIIELIFKVRRKQF